MAIDRRLLDLLCCPISKLPLQLADREQLARLQQLAAAGQLRRADGSPVDSRFGAVLVEPRSGRHYPVVDDIPVLLPEEAFRIAAAAADMKS